MERPNEYMARQRSILNKVFTGFSAYCRYGQHVSKQQARSTVESTYRSILPNIPGVPWWAALLIATTASAIGYAIDAGNTDLTTVFTGFYITGCVAAVLAVRQSGLFTAVIQPPLILFCAVPAAYWLFHGSKIKSLKDLLINCGYPLIERFPLMLGTAGSVLLIGLVRWFFQLMYRTTASSNSEDDTVSKPNSLISGITAVLNSILCIYSNDQNHRANQDTADTELMHSDPPLRTRQTARDNRSARTHSGQARRVVEYTSEPLVEPWQHSSQRSSEQARDFDAGESPRRSRRQPTPQSDPELRSQPPREIRRDAYGHRSGPYEWPTNHSSHLEPYRRYKQPGPPEHFTEHGQLYERYKQPRRRATPPRASSVNPISQVRYRGSTARDDPRVDRQRSQRPRRPVTESWEFDV